MTKDVIAAILERRSVRKFKQDEVPQATVGRLIDAARWAPSAGNVQPWEIYVVYNKDKKESIVKAAHHQQFIGDAPVVIVICARPEMSAAKYGDRGKSLYVIQDTAAVVQNILLAAMGYGLATCWVGAFDSSMLIEGLGLDSGLLPVAIIPVGFAEEGAIKQAPARRAVEEFVRIIE